MAALDNSKPARLDGTYRGATISYLEHDDRPDGLPFYCRYLDLRAKNLPALCRKIDNHYKALRDAASLTVLHGVPGNFGKTQITEYDGPAGSQHRVYITGFENSSRGRNRVNLSSTYVDCPENWETLEQAARLEARRKEIMASMQAEIDELMHQLLRVEVEDIADLVSIHEKGVLHESEQSV